VVPKELEGNPRRKPPEPAAGHSDIGTWFGQLMPNLQPIVRELDKTIRAVVLDLTFAVKSKRAFYGRPALGWIIEVAPYDVSINVVFLGGAGFDRPPPLGSTGRTRYVKLSSLAEVTRPAMVDWIDQAGRTPGWT